MIRKSTYFASRRSKGWPEPKDLEPYFLAPPGREWFFHVNNDSGGFTAEGVDGTDHLEANRGRIDIRLDMWGDREHGVMLIWSKWGGGHKQMYTSKGDMSRLRDYVRTMHGDDMPISFYIPFAEAWKAVKEFIEADGALPKSIEWVENRTLPGDTFPEP
jgi:hypothetical protein